MKDFSLYLLLLILFSCSIIRVVDVADINQKTHKIVAQAESGIRRVEMDLIDHEQILAKWSDSKSKQGLSRMKSLHQNLLQNFIRLKEDVANNQFQNHKKLTSKDKEFSSFNNYHKDIEGRFETLDKQFDKYRSESQSLNSYLESKSIYRINPSRIKDDFLNSINDAKRSQLKVKNELMEYNQQLSQSGGKKTIIQDLVKMVEQMENETFKLQRLFSAAMKEVNAGVKFVTPGMKAHDYIKKIEYHMKAIQKQIEQFNLKSKTLND